MIARKNILIPKRKKIFAYASELDGNGSGINWNNSTSLTQTYQTPSKPESVLSQEKKFNITIDPTQNQNNIDQTLGKDLNGSLKKGAISALGNSNWSGAVGAGMDLVNAGIEGATTGANNIDKGKASSQKGIMEETTNQASNVAQQYTAGQNQLNLLTSQGKALSAKDLKTHKGWKNVLGTAGKGAAAGASLGSMIMPGIGTAIGAAAGAVIGSAAAGIGEFFGLKKRKKEAERLKEKKRAEDYAVNYHNSRQAEQLQSANDNAAKIQADLNKQSVLNLVGYGGKLNRKNILLNKRNKLWN